MPDFDLTAQGFRLPHVFTKRRRTKKILCPQPQPVLHWAVTTEKTFKHFQNAEKVLQRIIGPEHDARGLIDYCDHGHENGILIKRNDSNQKNLQDVYRQISYLAKEAQKENVKGKRFFTSRFKKR